MLISLEDFTEPGSFVFVVPPGCTSLLVEAWGAGGGGGGGGGASPDWDGGGGGAGGAGSFVRAALHVEPGEKLNCTVGAGGASGVRGTHDQDELAYDRTYGSPGGDTRIVRGDSALLVAALGGSGGQGGKTGAGDGGSGGPKGYIAPNRTGRAGYSRPGLTGRSGTHGVNSCGDGGGDGGVPPSCPGDPFTPGTGGAGGHGGSVTGIGARPGSRGNDGCIVVFCFS
ncbi:glycine-rich domain-containing protein [Streptomyces lavendulae]